MSENGKNVDDTRRRQVEAALHRAAAKARALAEAANAPFIVWRDGKIVDLVAEGKKLAASDKK